MLVPDDIVKGPFAHTYSVVARDERTGEIGAGVQSHWFSVGTVVPWATAGVGAVVTQSFTNPAFGPEGLRLLSEGKTPRKAVEEMVSKDEGRDFRQLAIIDTKGRAFAYTGSRCVAEAGHICGKNFSVQANMMLNDTVWEAMAEAFENADGELADRIMLALEAAEAEGGDARGRQSAALVVVKPNSTGEVWKDRLIDLRVDDNRDPLKELARLLKVHRAYESMDAGDAALERGEMAAALKNYSKAERLFPRNEEMVFWHAVGMANNGRIKEAAPLFRRAFKRNPNWKVMVPRLVVNGTLRLNEEQLRMLIG